MEEVCVKLPVLESFSARCYAAGIQSSFRKSKEGGKCMFEWLFGSVKAPRKPQRMVIPETCKEGDACPAGDGGTLVLSRH